MQFSNNKNYVYPSLVLEKNHFMDSNLAPTKIFTKEYKAAYQSKNSFRVDINSSGFWDPYNSYLCFTIKNTKTLGIKSSYYSLIKSIKYYSNNKLIEEINNLDKFLNVLFDCKVSNNDRNKYKNIGFAFNKSNYDFLDGDIPNPLNNDLFSSSIAVKKGGITFSNDKMNICIPLPSSIFGILNPTQHFIPMYLLKNLSIEIELTTDNIENQKSHLITTRTGNLPLNTGFIRTACIIDNDTYYQFNPVSGENELVPTITNMPKMYNSGNTASDSLQNYMCFRDVAEICLPMRPCLTKSINLLPVIDFTDLKIISTEMFFETGIQSDVINSMKTFEIKTYGFASELNLINKVTPEEDLFFQYSNINYIGFCYYKQESKFKDDKKLIRYNPGISEFCYQINNSNYPSRDFTTSLSDDSTQNQAFLSEIKLAFNLNFFENPGILNNSNFAYNTSTRSGNNSFDSITPDITGKSVFIASLQVAPLEEGFYNGVNNNGQVIKKKIKSTIIDLPVEMQAFNFCCYSLLIQFTDNDLPRLFK